MNRNEYFKELIDSKDEDEIDVIK